MDYYGDVSGHLKGVLQEDCEICVAAVVAGDRVSCGRCAKKTVRNVTDIPEAKWNDLLDKQKRRLFECFAETDHLQFGYVTFERDKLMTMQNYHLLFEDVCFPPAWDLALEGYAYGEILWEMGANEENPAVMRFDRRASKPQSEAIGEHIGSFVPDVQVLVKGSRESPGIQAADCLAGAVAEDEKKGTDWLSELDDENIVECTATSLIQLENDLSNV